MAFSNRFISEKDICATSYFIHPSHIIVKRKNKYPIKKDKFYYYKYRGIKYKEFWTEYTTNIWECINCTGLILTYRYTERKTYRGIQRPCNGILK